LFSSFAYAAEYKTLLEFMPVGKKHTEMREDSALLKLNSSESAVVKLAKRTTTQFVCGGTVEGATAIHEHRLKISV
jgi:hypothetical protein